MEVGNMAQDDEPSILIRGLAIILFDEGKTEVEIADLLFISDRPFAQCKSLVNGKGEHEQVRVQKGQASKD